MTLEKAEGEKFIEIVLIITVKHIDILRTGLI